MSAFGSVRHAFAAMLLLLGSLICFSLAAGPAPPREPLAGLIPSPRFFPGVGRWQLAHKIPRGRIYAVAWSPDGKQIAFAEATYVRICDAHSFDPVRFLVGHANRVTSIDWNRATNRIASASWDGTVRLWSADGVPQHVLKGHTGPVNGVAWTKDGARLASAGSDGTLRIWNADGSAGRVIPANAGVNCVTWNPDGSRVATGDDNRQVKIWTADGQLQHVCNGHVDSVTSIAWSPDGKWLGSATYGSEGDDADATQIADVRLWNADGAATGFLVDKEAICGLGWNPDSSSLVVSSLRNHLRLFEPNGKVKATLQIPNIESQLTLLPLAISPAGDEFVVGGTGGINVCAVADPSQSRASPRTPIVDRRYLEISAVAPNCTRVILRPLDAGPQTTSFNLMTGASAEVPSDVAHSKPTDDSFDPTGNRLVFTGGEMQLSIWDPEGESTVVVAHATRPILASAWSPLGDRLGYCDDQETIHVVKLDGTSIVDLPPKQTPPAAAVGSTETVRLRFSPDAKRLVLQRNSRIEVRPLDGTKGAAFDFGGAFERFWISPDLRRAAMTHEIEMEAHAVSFWPAGATAPKNLTDLGTHIDSLDCSPDVTRLVVGYTNGNWIMRRLDDPAAPQVETRAHDNTLMATLFAPDGQRFATGGWDATVKIWTLDGTLVRTLSENTHPLFKLWWSPDGKRLLSTARDGTICLWSTAAGRLESHSILTVPGSLLHIPNDGLFPAKEAAAASNELFALIEKPNGAMERIEYTEFLNRTVQSAR